MDTTINYADILKQTVKDATIHQPRLQKIKLYPVCDVESGNFVVLATGFDKKKLDGCCFISCTTSRER